MSGWASRARPGPVVSCVSDRQGDLMARFTDKVTLVTGASTAA